MHQKSVAGFEDAVPYLTALIELDEQPLLLLVTNLPGANPDTLHIGDRVHVTFEPQGDGLMLPQFVLEDTRLPFSSQASPEPSRRGEGAGGEVAPSAGLGAEPHLQHQEGAGGEVT
jgi:hypothetical protein